MFNPLSTEQNKIYPKGWRWPTIEKKAAFVLKYNQISESFSLCSAVIELIQTDVSQYPFHQQPPAYLRAHRYRYWFTQPKADGSVLSLALSLPLFVCFHVRDVTPHMFRHYYNFQTQMSTNMILQFITTLN